MTSSTAGAKGNGDDDDDNSISMDVLMESSQPSSLLAPAATSSSSPTPDDDPLPIPKTTRKAASATPPRAGRIVQPPREGRKMVKKATTVSTSKSMSPMRPRPMVNRVVSAGTRRSPARNKMPLRLPSKSDRRGKMRVAGEFLSDRSLQSASLREGFKSNLDDDDDASISPFDDPGNDDQAALAPPAFKRNYSSSKLQIVEVIETKGSGDSGASGGTGAAMKSVPRKNNKKTNNKGGSGATFKRNQTMPEGDVEKIAADLKAKAAKGTDNFSKRVTDKVVKRASSMTSPLRPSLSFDSNDDKKKDKKKKKQDNDAMRKARSKDRSMSPAGMFRASTAPKERSMSPIRMMRSSTNTDQYTKAKQQRPKATRTNSIKRLAAGILSPKSNKKDVLSSDSSKSSSYNQLSSRMANKFSKSLNSLDPPLLNNNSGGNKNARWTAHTPQDKPPPKEEDAPASWSFRRSLQAPDAPQQKPEKLLDAGIKKKKSKDKDAKEKKKEKKEKKKLKKQKSINRSVSPTTLRRMSSSFSKFEDMKFDLKGEQNKIKAKDKAREEIKAIKERKAAAANKKRSKSPARRVDSSKSSSKKSGAAPVRHIRRNYTNPDNVLPRKKIGGSATGGGGASGEEKGSRRESMKRASSVSNYLRNSSRSLTGSNMANYIRTSSRSLKSNMANYIRNSSKSLTDNVKKTVSKKKNKSKDKKEDAAPAAATAAAAGGGGGLQSVAEQYRLAFPAADFGGSSEINFDAAFKEKSENLIKVILSSQSDKDNNNNTAASEQLQQEQANDDDFLFEAMKMASPTPYLCPISDNIMKDPVTTAVGSTYERKAIQWWLTKSDIDPVTQQRIPDKALTPNNELKETIENWKEDFKKQLSPTTDDSSPEKKPGAATDSTTKKQADGVKAKASAAKTTAAKPSASVPDEAQSTKDPKEKEKKAENNVEASPPQAVDATAGEPEARIEKISYKISPAPKREFSPIKDLVIEDIEIEDVQLDEWRPSAPPPPPPPPVVVTDPDDIKEPEEVEKISLPKSAPAKTEFAPIKDLVIEDIEIEDVEIEDIQMDEWRPSAPPPPPPPVVVTDPDDIEEPEEVGDPMDSEIEQMLESLRRSSEVPMMDDKPAEGQGAGSSLLGPGGALDGPSEHSLPGYNWTAATEATSALGGTPGELDAPSEHSLPGYNWTAATTTASSALGGTPGELGGPSEHSGPGYNWTATPGASSALGGTSTEPTDKTPAYDWKAASPKQNAKEKVDMAGTGFWTDLTATNSPNSQDGESKESLSPSKTKSMSPSSPKKKTVDKMSQSASALMDILAWGGDDSDSDDDSSDDSSSDESAVARQPQQKIASAPKPRRKSMFDSDSDSDSDDDDSSDESSSEEPSVRGSSMGSLGLEDLGAPKSLLGGSSSSDEDSEDSDEDNRGYSLPNFSGGKGDSSEDVPAAGFNKNRRRTLKPFSPFHSSMSALDDVQFTPTNFIQQREERFDDYYKLGQLLGEGEFGEVFIGYQKQGSGLGEERAIKIIDKHRMCAGDYEQVINEFNLLKGLTHPNLLTLYGFYEDSSNCYIVTDLCKGGELWDELDARGNFEEAEAAAFMTNLLSAVKFLQSHKIVHRDLNLENILLEENKELDQMKIIDFGLATKYEDGVKLTELVGKVHYVAPEVLQMSYEGSKYDVWSCGVVAFILLSGYAPFEADNDMLVMEQITIGLGDANFNDPAWDGISDEAKDFVKHLMTYEEDSRPTAEQALKHAWIQNSIQESRESFMKAYGGTSISCFENMQDFASDVSDVSLLKLKQAVYVFIASQLLLKEEREEIDRVFRGMDNDCDGKLSKPDIKFGYKRFFNKDLSDKETDQMFDRINTSRTGFIDYTEFVIAAMQKSKILDKEKLKAAFSSFDRADKGFISANDLKLALAGVIALPVDNQDGLDADKIIQEMIRQVDTEGDGKISYQNFEDMMMAEEIEGGPKDMEVDEDPASDPVADDAAAAAAAVPPPPEFSRTSSLDYNFATASFMGNAKQSSAIAAQVQAIMEE